MARIQDATELTRRQNWFGLCTQKTLPEEIVSPSVRPAVYHQGHPGCTCEIPGNVPEAPAVCESEHLPLPVVGKYEPVQRCSKVLKFLETYR
jgi:hypothetical protein